MATSQFQHLFLELRFFYKNIFFQIFLLHNEKRKKILQKSEDYYQVKIAKKLGRILKWVKREIDWEVFLCENNLFTKSDFTKKYTNGDNYLSVVFGYWNLFHSKCLLTYVGFRYDLAQQRLIWNLKHDELPSHMPNLVQLHRLSYIGPETQLYILPLLLVSVSSA